MSAERERGRALEAGVDGVSDSPSQSQYEGAEGAEHVPVRRARQDSAGEGFAVRTGDCEAGAKYSPIPRHP